METSEFIRNETTANAQVLTPVSSGATCETFRFQRWDKWFLLKRLRPELHNDPAAISAFEKEFDLGIRLDHPGIVRYFEKGTDKYGIYLVEEFIDGETLDVFLTHNSPLPDREAKRIFSEIAAAVSYLHENGIIHADLKPDNLLITRQGHHPKLIDLGFSSQYSYPPVKEGDTRADILALGKLLKQIAPNSFKRIIRKATSTDPDKRYGSVEEMIAALHQKPERWLSIPVALLILAAICLPFLRKPAAPDPQIVTIRDTLVIRDTIYTIPKPSKPTVQERFRQVVRKESEQMYAPFYASFDSVTQNNISDLIGENRQLHADLHQRLIQIKQKWAQQYPKEDEDFEQIIGEEFNRILLRFQIALKQYN